MNAAAVAGTKTYTDLSRSELSAKALERGEGVLSANQALCVETGTRTGRSPKDRYIVQDNLTRDTVDWGIVNQPMAFDQFSQLWTRAEHYLQEKTKFIAHLRVGADPEHFLPVKVITETAWHNLFANNLFIRPEGNFADNKPVWTILSTPGLTLDPAKDGTHGDGAVMINFSSHKVLLIGMRYAGEMKKSMFSALNYLLPEHGILPMHCAANVGKSGDVALFFGLSGTGKTTLSADPDRYLIGDDEHGWNDEGVFNFEGGCYAKCIDLSKEREPVIWNAIKAGAIMENVILDSNGVPDFNNARLTQNTRAAYPREHIPLRALKNRAGQPQAVIFLTCDLYGVLPPVALLTKEQAAYYFLSGYTALVGSTEVGQTAGVRPTFSTCFGAPFFPRPAQVYANLLMKHIDKSGAQVYLVNTGWTGGGYGQGGKRFAIPTTRTIINAILNGDILQTKHQECAHFGFKIPEALKGVDSQILNPRQTWSSQHAFDKQANILMEKFITNFQKFDVSDEIRQAGPRL